MSCRQRRSAGPVRNEVGPHRANGMTGSARTEQAPSRPSPGVATQDRALLRKHIACLLSNRAVAAQVKRRLHGADSAGTGRDRPALMAVIAGGVARKGNDAWHSNS